MSLDAAYIVPHPPLAIAEVGRGEERKISATLDAFREVARRIAARKPDCIVFLSPHSAYYGDWIYIARGDKAYGDMGTFGAMSVGFVLDYDNFLRSELLICAEHAGLKAGYVDVLARPLDHGLLVPLYFINQEYPNDRYKAVSIGGSGLPRKDLLAFGRCIARAAARRGGSTVLVASGDLSHKLKADGPYGYDPAGPWFDAAFEAVVNSGDPRGFAEIDPLKSDSAAECGLSGFIMLAGALEEASNALCGTCTYDVVGDAVEDVAIDLPGTFTSELLSLEGPFGVGYGVAAFERRSSAGPVVSSSDAAKLQDDKGSDPREGDSSADLQAAESGGSGASPDPTVSVAVDPLVALARETIEEYVRTGEIPQPPMLSPDLPLRAGVFVSIHTASTGELRGCIGTIEPTRAHLSEEVIGNAVSASTRDPRFPAISPAELDDLAISVDVLFPPEPAQKEGLDPKRYGVIVTQGFKRGLLLPDLEGVDTVDRQLSIACMKAGIDYRGDYGIERFEVVRHE